MLIIKNTLLQGTGITNIYIKDNLIADISPIFVKNKNDKVFDAKGKVVLPGLIDSHLHSCLSVTLSSAISCDLKNAKNVNDLKKTIKNHIIKHKIKEGEWVYCVGFFGDQFETNRYSIDRDVLDSISTKHKILVLRSCLHIGYINSKIIKDYKIKNSKNVNVDSGIIEDSAISEFVSLIPPLTEKQLTKVFYEFFMSLAKKGLTSIQTNDYNWTDQTSKIKNVFEALAKSNKLPIRIFEQVLVHSESEAVKNIKLFKQNNNLLEYSTLKAVADGSFGASTAAMIEHYKGDNNNFGKLNYSNENLLKIIKVSVNNNIPIAIHCIGDKATLQCCELFNKVKKTAYSNQIVHATTLNENLLRYIKKLNLQISSQPSFISDDYNMAPLKLNAKQLKYSYLFKTFFDLGINVGGSSDSPVCDNNPFVGIHAAVNRIGGDKVFMPKECLSVQQGINLYTKNAAKLVYRKNIGEIKKGYLADLIVLDKNIYKLNKMDIDKIKPILTIVNGKIIYKKG